MIRSRKKLHTDPNQLAAEIVRLSTEEREEKKSAHPSVISKYLSTIGRKGGKKGGPARAKKLTAAARSEIARIAATARWKNR